MRLPIATLAFATAFLGASPLLAQDGPPPFIYSWANPDVVETVGVVLKDSTRGGCWTNLGEAKTYAEDQLRMRGYEVSDEFGWTFEVGVTSGRDSEVCYGATTIKLGSGAEIYGTKGVFQIGGGNVAFMRNGNVNILVLEEIKRVVDSMPERKN